MILSVGIQAPPPTPNALQSQILSIPTLKFKPFTVISASSSSPISNEGKKKLGVVVKPMEKQRLVLRFIWLEKNIGIAIDRVIPGTIPVSPYYFWPKKDAWEELKVMMESKHWISYMQMVTLISSICGSKLLGIRLFLVLVLLFSNLVSYLTG